MNHDEPEKPLRYRGPSPPPEVAARLLADTPLPR